MPSRIEGEWYWDGGLSGNRPRRQLVIDTKASDILLLQVTPQLSQVEPRPAAAHFAAPGSVSCFPGRREKTGKTAVASRAETGSASLSH